MKLKTTSVSGNPHRMQDISCGVKHNVTPHVCEVSTFRALARHENNIFWLW